MKVLFDHQIFAFQKYGGASKYFCEIIKRFPKEIWMTSTLYSNNEYIESYNLFSSQKILPDFSFRGKERIISELGKNHSKIIFKQKNYDIFHQTFYDPYSLKYIGNKPMVMTFYDINFSTFNYNRRVINYQKESFKRANKIITISNNTKYDLIKNFYISDEKISVIYLGIDNVDLSSLRQERIIENKYILYVGEREKNKNWYNFINVFKKIKEIFPEIKLICTGKMFSGKEIDFIKLNNLERAIILFSATEEQMKRLYRDAELFVYPSYYEGFGMPLLEAMVCNCPVVCSNTSCFPEIAGDAAYYFDPYSDNDMFDVISKVLNSQEIREKLRERGKKRAGCFSWDKCASEHIELYNNLLS